MLSIIGGIVPIIVPVFLDINLLILKTRSALEWWGAAWMAVCITLYFYMVGGWFLSSYYIRYAIIPLLVAAVVMSYLRLPKDAWNRNHMIPAGKLTMISYAITTVILTVMAGLALAGQSYPSPAVTLQFPLKGGRYYFAQAGSTTAVNYHHGAGSQTYAQDILELNEFGRDAAGFSPVSLDEYAIYGKPVVSPCDGTVSVVVDGLPDLAPGAPGDKANAAGNHVYIDCPIEKVQVLLAHMKTHSVSVKVGADIKIGDPIGQVGNSGNTTEPHLHIHARRGGSLDQLIGGTGIPILYAGKFFTRNAIYFQE